MTTLFDMRRNYSQRTLDENDISPDPITLFETWFDEAVKAEALEPNAMCLSTATRNGQPSSRIVLLKQIKPEGFVFFTNYNSRKGEQMAENHYCALNFVWNELERQVRIEGTVEKILPAESDTYFDVRPAKSKLGAWASPQSQPIPNRECLERLMAEFETRYEGEKILRPENWGGYIVHPTLIEFWQGRENRLHDRIQYTKKGAEWKIVRLAP